MRSNILIITVSILVAFACSEEREVKPLTYPKIFTGETQKSWVIDEFYITKVGEADQPFSFESCELDDRYTFKADSERSFVIDNGATKCPVAEGEEEEEDVYLEYSWSFTNASSQMIIPIPRIFGNFLIPFTVKEITKNRMVMEVYANAENTITYKVVMRSVDEQ